jgi:malate permease and related proteins
MIFLSIFYKILPYYLLVVAGFIAGRKLQIKKETLASLLIYIISPVVVFNAILTTPLTGSTLLLPVVIYVIACILCVTTYMLARRIWHDSTKNILAFTAGTGNTGFFGIPVAMALFGQQGVNLLLVGIMGSMVYDLTLGYFITARGHHSIYQSLLRVLRLPAIYAVILALLMKDTMIATNGTYQDIIGHFISSSIVLGMMLLGISVSEFEKLVVDWKFLGIAFVARFVVWPLAMIGVLWLDASVFHIFTLEMRRVLTLMSVVPLAVVTVAYATELHAQPEKAALAVLLSTIFAIFYVPLMLSIFI